MRKIIVNGEIVTDHWITVHPGDNGDIEVPEKGDVLVSLETWQTKKDELIRHDGRIGLLLNGDAELDDFVDDLDQFDLIAVNFPKFADGRGYSLARLIRERAGYTGELRAVGDVLRDQLFYLHRCGFNAFVIREDRDVEDALNAFNDFTVTYQADVHEERPIYHRRPA
ncbi:MAG: DUF934 domain-containing protein [Ketobacteraceae bacterium]|nr:DUF934 domain-containing protein [Ketobacteraceae bacterium]